jgi:hypothetical protein
MNQKVITTIPSIHLAGWGGIIDSGAQLPALTKDRMIFIAGLLTAMRGFTKEFQTAVQFGDKIYMEVDGAIYNVACCMMPAEWPAWAIEIAAQGHSLDGSVPTFGFRAHYPSGSITVNLATGEITITGMRAAIASPGIEKDV